MTDIDWAMQEALEEVDRLTPACPPVAPRRLTDAEIAIALGMQNASNRAISHVAQMQLSNAHQAQRDVYLMRNEPVPLALVAIQNAAERRLAIERWRRGA